MLLGNILLKYRSRDIHEVSGLWRTMPFTAVLFAGGALALGGMPPFGMFTSEFAIAVAGIYAGKIWLIVFMFDFPNYRVSRVNYHVVKNGIR